MGIPIPTAALHYRPRPPSFRAEGLMFYNNVLFFSWPHDQYLDEFYNASPKIRGRPLKKFGGGPKTCQIWADFTQLPTLITNISGTKQDIQNRKDM